MSINLGLLGQTFTFLVFVWFTMKFVWPPLEQALAARKKAIEEGLASAEKAKVDLADAQTKVKDELKAAREKAAEIIEQANSISEKIVQDATASAEKLKNEILRNGEDKLALEIKVAKDELRAQVASLVVLGMRQIFQSEFDDAKHKALLTNLAESLK